MRPPRLRCAGAVCLIAIATLGCSLPGGPEPTAVPAVSDPSSVRWTTSGEVVGLQGRYGSHAWRGIPYARPPVGALRWRGPLAPESWAGTREALVAGPACPQLPNRLTGGGETVIDGVSGSEDCLYLDIASPVFRPDDLPQGEAALPVMVWIHGGGNTIGRGSSYEGGNLAVTHRVIVVTLNYRLGAFGWFRHPALRSANTTPAERSGNFGTLDLIQALEWVRESIAGFGGDPENVTIFGESAGGSNVISLLDSPLARGLFHRAIVQSGSASRADPVAAEAYTDAVPRGDPHSTPEITLELLQQDGTAADRDAARAHVEGLRPPQIADYLRSRSPAQILAAYGGGPRAGMYRLPRLFSDGVVLQDEPPARRFAREGGYSPVPVILGTNRDEQKLFLFIDPRRVRRWFGILPSIVDPRRYALEAEYASKIWKVRGVDDLASAMRSRPGPEVYAYRFDWDEEPKILWADLGDMLGAAHGLEIPFVFGDFDGGSAWDRLFDEDNAPGRRALSETLMSYWAEMAYTGDPGRGRDGRQPRWEPWDESSSRNGGFMRLDTKADGGPEMVAGRLRAQDVVDQIDADTRFADQRERCEMLLDLLRSSEAFGRAEYLGAGSRGCADYPPEAYPWED